ncbi:MAG: DUF6916 family protein [Planctomycetota bacterium]
MAELTRRAFVGQVGVVAVAAPVLGDIAPQNDPLGLERFQPLVGESFRVTSDGRTWRTCVLEEAVATGAAPRPQFRASATKYVLHHRATGRIELHLNPVERDERLEAVIS